MLVHRRVTPSSKFSGTHLYSCVERGTVRVKCLTQKCNTMFPVRARTRTARSGVERTKHGTTTPPQRKIRVEVQFKRLFSLKRTCCCLFNQAQSIRKIYLILLTLVKLLSWVVVPLTMHSSVSFNLGRSLYKSMI